MASETLWDEKRLENPHAEADKRSRVRGMFAAIAPSYDLNNRLHSMGVDQYWRNKAVKLAGVKADDQVVDVACGTGDLTHQFAHAVLEANQKKRGASGQCPHEAYPPFPRVLGIDFTYEMLPIAQRKYIDREVSVYGFFGYGGDQASFDRGGFSFARFVRYINGDAQCLPLPDASADIVSIAFGIRNVQEPLVALKEFRRVLKPGGRCVVLEFSVPTNPIVRAVYNFYCERVMPVTATWVSGDRSGAYKYLPQSVATFLGRGEMVERMKEAGFSSVKAVPLTFGAVVVYVGEVSASAECQR